MDENPELEETVRSWLMCAEEYLNDAQRLLFRRLDEGKVSSRPTTLLLGYFIEAVLKAAVVQRTKVYPLKNYKHVGAHLFEDAGLRIEDKRDSDLVEFLSACVVWGKYPAPKKPQDAEMISSATEVYANQTVFFNSLAHTQDLIAFSVRSVNGVHGALRGSGSSEQVEMVDAFIDRIESQLGSIMERISRAMNATSQHRG